MQVFAHAASVKYYKLLLNIESPKDVTKEQRQVYEFLKQGESMRKPAFCFGY